MLQQVGEIVERIRAGCTTCGLSQREAHGEVTSLEGFQGRNGHVRVERLIPRRYPVGDRSGIDPRKITGARRPSHCHQIPPQRSYGKYAGALDATATAHLPRI
jgi:hypothetical protein